MGEIHGPKIVRDGLVLALDAADINSYPGTGNTWYDLSGNGHTFTLYNTPTYSSGAILLDGSNDYIASTATLDLTLYDYIAVEVRYKSNITTGGMLFEHTNNWNTNNGGFGNYTNGNGSTSLTNVNHTNHKTGVARNYYVDNNQEWTSNVDLFSKLAESTGRLSYNNGELIPFGSINGYSTTTITPSSQFANDTFYIGSRGGTGAFFNGSILSLKIYGRKFTAAEILQNYNATKTRFGL